MKKVIYIWGGQGTGKTQLARSIPNSVEVSDLIEFYDEIADPANDLIVFTTNDKNAMPEVIDYCNEMDVTFIELNAIQILSKWL